MRDSIKQNGWWFTASHPECFDGLIDIALEMGHPVGARRKAELIEILRPTETKLANRNSLSSRFDLSAFPYHCDTAHWPTPCRYVVMGCKDPGNCGRNTVLIGWQKIKFEIDEIDLLRSAVFLIKNGQKSFYSTMLELNESFLRFDPGCMNPTDDKARNALKLMENKLNDIQKIQITWSKDSVLILDNWRTRPPKPPD